MHWKNMGITNSSLEAIALAASGDKPAAVAAVRRLREHALALRETAKESLAEASAARQAKEAEVAALRSQVLACPPRVLSCPTACAVCGIVNRPLNHCSRDAACMSDQLQWVSSRFITVCCLLEPCFCFYASALVHRSLVRLFSHSGHGVFFRISSSPTFCLRSAPSKVRFAVRVPASGCCGEIGPKGRKSFQRRNFIQGFRT
jgi:hypothetical protein